MIRTLEQIALDVMRCAFKSPTPDTELLPGVKARELVRVIESRILSCPQCGAEPWCNIDCDLCNMCALLQEEGNAAESEGE